MAVLAMLAGIINFLLNPYNQLPKKDISFEEIERLPGPILFVDARNAVVFDAGHITDAVNLPENDFDRYVNIFLDKWAPGSQVVVYCDIDRCNAGEAVAYRLREDFQLNNIYVLKDDWRLWEKYQRR